MWWEKLLVSDINSLFSSPSQATINLCFLPLIYVFFLEGYLSNIKKKQKKHTHITFSLQPNLTDHRTILCASGYLCIRNNKWHIVVGAKRGWKQTWFIKALSGKNGSSRVSGSRVWCETIRKFYEKLQTMEGQDVWLVTPRQWRHHYVIKPHCHAGVAIAVKSSGWIFLLSAVISLLVICACWSSSLPFCPVFLVLFLSAH